MVPVHEISPDAHALLQALAANPERAPEEEQRLKGILRESLTQAPLVGVAPVRRVPPIHPAVELAGYLVAKRRGLVTSFPRSSAESDEEHAREPKPVPVTHMESEEQVETLQHFNRFCGVPIACAWVLPFLDNVELASLDAIGANHRDASREVARDLLKRAELVLEKTVAEMSTWPTQLELPPWLDAPLTAYLIGRYGFANGGGARVISRKTMTSLLAQPRRLAKELAKAPDGKNRFRRTLVLVKREVAEG